MFYTCKSITLYDVRRHWELDWVLPKTKTNFYRLIPNRLYYMVVRQLPLDSETCHYFCTDEVFRYYNYFLDFGPLNISQIHSFCTVVSLYPFFLPFYPRKMKSRKFKNKKLCYCSRSDPKLMINSVLLVCCYLVLFYIIIYKFRL